jgi:hypothetical protein
VSVGLAAVPSLVDKIYMGSAPDITHFIQEPLNTKEEIR